MGNSNQKAVRQAKQSALDALNALGPERMAHIQSPEEAAITKLAHGLLLLATAYSKRDADA